MNKKDDPLWREWERNISFSWCGEKFVIENDEKIPRMLVGIDRITFRLAQSSDKLFSARFTDTDRIEDAGTKLGRDLIAIRRLFDPVMVRQYLSCHTMSPYFDLWEKHWHDVCTLLILGADRVSVDVANDIVERVRLAARRSEFTNALRNHRRVASKNWQGFRNYIDGLFEEYSKLLVVRVDLGFRYNPYEALRNRSHVGELEARKHLRKMLRYLRRNVPECVGSAWKLEYGAGKGFHVHLLVFLHGHHCREGITWGRRLGEKWETITAGTGSYWNCNADEEFYRRRGLLGIGLIRHCDRDLRAGLARTAMYLVKVDAYAKLQSKGNARNFGRGEIKARPAGKRVGRPRKALQG